MAGMLPGVESARRRRSGGWSDPPPLSAGSTRRSSFCLYAAKHATHLVSQSSLDKQRGRIEEYDELGEAAREAKERLDEKLRKKACTPAPASGLPTEVFGKGAGGSKRFVWNLLGVVRPGEDCPVCLDRFRPGESLVHLPCDHRFHSRCVVPWLEAHAHCPCCRKLIFPLDLPPGSFN